MAASKFYSRTDRPAMLTGSRFIPAGTGPHPGAAALSPGKCDSPAQPMKSPWGVWTVAQ